MASVFTQNFLAASAPAVTQASQPSGNNAGVTQMAVSLTQDFFYVSVALIAAAGVAYLIFTLSNRQAVLATLSDIRTRRARGKAAIKVSAEGASGGGGAGTATLTREFEIAATNVDPDYRAEYWGRIGTGAAWFSVITLLISLIFRTVVMQYPPWVNMYGYSLSFSWALLLCYLLFERRYHSRALGVFATGAALLMIAFAIYLGIAYNQATTSYTVIPALQDQKVLILHVSMAIFAYALFTLAFGCGIVYLLQTQTDRFSWLPSAEAADELGYKAVIIGFPLLALNLIIGAYWANYAWGHYWSWDPKETSALVTWLVYAIYLHVRGVRGLRNKWSGWLLVLGFAATLFTYFGVSFIVPGLHSYAGV